MDKVGICFAIGFIVFLSSIVLMGHDGSVRSCISSAGMFKNDSDVPYVKRVDACKGWYLK